MPAHMIIAELFMLALGAAMVVIYVVVARKRWGLHLDPVQAVLYRANVDSLPLGERVLERVLRLLKFIGLIAIIIAIASPFIET